jgi:hypothetical protein
METRWRGSIRGRRFEIAFVERVSISASSDRTIKLNRPGVLLEHVTASQPPGGPRVTPLPSSLKFRCRLVAALPAGEAALLGRSCPYRKLKAADDRLRIG